MNKDKQIELKWSGLTKHLQNKLEALHRTRGYILHYDRCNLKLDMNILQPLQVSSWLSDVLLAYVLVIFRLISFRFASPIFSLALHPDILIRKALGG